VDGQGEAGFGAQVAGPGRTVAVVGDGAVGLLGVLAAKQLGAERIIAMSRHEPRQKPAIDYGAANVVTERGDDGVARIKDLTGLGAHSVIEAVGTQESMMQAIRATRPGGHVGYVGVAHDVQLPGEELFFSHVHLHGGPAPVRRYLPELIDLIWNRQIDPAKSSTSNCLSIKRPPATGQWTPGRPSRCCSAPDRTARVLEKKHDASAADHYLEPTQAGHGWYMPPGPTASVLALLVLARPACRARAA
jgi:Zinc-binding dehydrogenase